ncbi:protein of unknown function [Haloplanus vescus]|uniref:DUF1508 domain-containing protein n=1 Tax=Haloplanus vescus TaxID=555874 RepID=A0A1H3YJ09_9EURY|nr:YegP family protein [Haloplanus vescus]SEA10922.1 protein of unknown function [Haloplanus vescus]
MPDATFQVFDDDAGVRWRLRDGDGAVLAVSDSAYDTEHDAMRAVQRLKHVAATAGVESTTSGT